MEWVVSSWTDKIINLMTHILLSVLYCIFCTIERCLMSKKRVWYIVCQTCQLAIVIIYLQFDKIRYKFTDYFQHMHFNRAL